MQYLLTEAELNGMVPRQELAKANAALDVARKLILFHSKFPCVHTREGDHNYCDDCPISIVENTLPKKNNHPMSVICNLSRSYSQ